MVARTSGAVLCTLLMASFAFGQAGSNPSSAVAPAARARAGRQSSAVPGTKGSGTLPNDHQQVWREYDIRPYTAKVEGPKPEQTVVDWILRETGTEVWFSEPLGLLNAKRDKLTVYHTPEMQEIVRQVLQRFMNRDAETQLLGVRLITVNSPNWRSLAHPLLRPVEVQSQGVEAWLLTKENAAVLMAQLSKRTDFREHNSPNLLVQNGQSQALAKRRPRSYVRTVRPSGTTFPGHEVVMGQVEEGYSLQISPLMSLDQRTVDAVIRCHVDQIEKMVNVPIDVPGLSLQKQRVQTQVPQIVSWRLHERFRWPTDQVLLLSCGVVAAPGPERPKPLGLPNPLNLGPSRTDALLLLEAKGRASQALVEPRATIGSVPNYRGRY